MYMGVKESQTEATDSVARVQSNSLSVRILVAPGFEKND